MIVRENPVLGARSQFGGVGKFLKLGTVMAEVVVVVGDIEIVAATTLGPANDTLDPQGGDNVKAVVKATEVMVAKD